MSIHQRNYNTRKEFNALAQPSKQICVPMSRENYQQFITDASASRREVDLLIQKFPELFPKAITQGYTWHDILPESKKMSGIRLRRLKINDTAEVFTIRPSFIMRHMTAFTDDVEKALFLRQWVPYWALVYVFGKDVDFWYRLETHFGHNSIVGTTVKSADQLPTDLLADEKFTDFNGQTAYIATTVGNDCILGASIVLNADADSLTEAYGHFKTEAQNVSATYQPSTVNTDGWRATHQAWQTLYAKITVILCFLHSFINIRTCCKRLKEHYETIKTQVWQAYHAPDRASFEQKIAKLKEWALATLPEGTGQTAILKLCGKVALFATAYDYPSAYRTSNMIDRHMVIMSRYLETHKHFHGHLSSAEFNVRAMALLSNFRPYCPTAKVVTQQKYTSPAHKLNGRTYHDNWLHNLLISASLGGVSQ